LKRLILIILVMIAGCTTPTPSREIGMQPEHAGYVPARIAILPCMQWPNGAHYKDLPLTNIKSPAIKEFCKKFDKFVIAGFSDQPYMRGYSPTGVKKAMTKSGKDNLLGEFAINWNHEAKDCNTCTDQMAFYTSSIAEREKWITWLDEVSKSVHHADAILVPYVMYAYERKLNDRGLLIAERAAGVSMFLIDTGTGSLLWAGGRNSKVPNKLLERRGTVQTLSYPAWDTATDRLFIEELWRSFPGRQVF